MALTGSTKRSIGAAGGERNIETQAWHALIDIHGGLFRRLNRTLAREFGITLAKFDVLAQLHRAPEGLTQGILSRQLKVTDGNVTGLVRRLVVDGLIDRQMSANDRRAFIVSITPRGAEAYLNARARHDELLQSWLAPISRDELNVLHAIMARLSRAEIEGRRGDTA